MAIHEYDFNVDHALHFQGCHFFKSAVVLRDNPVHYSKSPYFMLLAFSIELMLKSLYVKRIITTSRENPSIVNSVKIEHAKGHSLIEVFKNHPYELQKWLSESVSVRYGLAIEDVLDEHSELFDKARYIYPRKGVMEGGAGYSVNESALYDVAEFLSFIPEIIRGN